MEPLLIDLNAAAEVLSVSPRQVDKLIKAGELDTVVMGPRLTRVTTASLHAFVERNAQPGTNTPGAAADEKVAHELHEQHRQG